MTDIMRKMEKNGNLKTRLSNKETYTIYHRAGFTRRAYNDLCSFLTDNLSVSPFPYIYIVRQDERVHASRDLFNVRIIPKHSGNGSRDVVVVELKKLKEIVVTKLEKMAEMGTLTFDEATGRKIWFCISSK
ncbi:hypothetical protein B9Z55_002551 [Caenorhabditis nigoni]|uniref:Uncharacterized protein n=1 Tax=Caenorhabditis nigoni TaxID=1611254 RepID=A0A2G5VLA7_9PELO|nr:hypothetical protein B9Z55_002551 [Caenorhabditis nigoni]